MRELIFILGRTAYALISLILKILLAIVRWLVKIVTGYEKQYGRSVWTRRGEKVRSKGERRIADWLDRHGIDYQYEAQLRIQGRPVALPDFYLPGRGIVVEYYGLFFTLRGYRKKAEAKMRMYDGLGIRHIAVMPGDLQNLDSKLRGLL